jgi:hypothetical protein
MKPIRTWVLPFIALAALSPVLCAEETESEEDTKPDFPSPDGQHAFQLTGKSLDENQTFDLINKRSGKKLLRIASHDPDDGPSSRFNFKVLWRPDSKAFAVKGTLWKRGSFVDVYLREGSKFRKVEKPEFQIEITEKMKGGKQFPHVVELDSETPTKWRKDGSLVVEIETVVDGEGGTLTANRTLVLAFRNGQTKILKSTTNFSVEND